MLLWDIEELEEHDMVAIIQLIIRRAEIPATNLLLIRGDLSSLKRGREGSGAVKGSLRSLNDWLSLIFIAQYQNGINLKL